MQQQQPLQLEGVTYDLGEVIKTVITGKDVAEAIAAAMIPTLTVMFDKMLSPLKEKVDAQNKELSSMRTTIDGQLATIKQLKTNNVTLSCQLRNAESQIKDLQGEVDDVEQYSRRSSLRFHRVPIPAATSGEGMKIINTDDIVLDICNNKLKLSPPISAQDIDRSHPIGRPKDGKMIVLCKFNRWSVKNQVYKNKSNLKTYKSESFNVFITEDLTRKRQQAVQQLDQMRKNRDIDSFWTNDGRIFYKTGPNDKVRTVNKPDQLTDLLTDNPASMLNNPWNH